MTLRDIDFILELAQTQNFNRAAENLYTSQPTFSYHIKVAEEELGFQIFTRTNKGAVLTPAGAQSCVTLRNVRACFISRRVRIFERIFRRSRRETAGILCGFQG